MKKIFFALLLAITNTLICCEIIEEQAASTSFLGSLPPEMMYTLRQFVLDLASEATLGLYLKRMKELYEVEQFSIFKEIHDKLHTLEFSTVYDDMLMKVKELSQDDICTPLFRDPDFIRVIVRELLIIQHRGLALASQNLDAQKLDAQTIATELNTPGALLWLKQLKLMDAIKKGELQALQDALNEGINPNFKDEFGENALIIAIADNQMQIAQLLINSGANINARGRRGKTVLMYAASQGNEEIVKMLIDRGGAAQLLRHDDQGKDALAWAKNEEIKAIIRGDRSTKDKAKEMLEAYFKKHPEAREKVKPQSK